MAKYEKLLEETVAFHRDLIRYANLLRENEHEAAARLRADLTVRFGRLEDDLTELGLPRRYEQFGRILPIFESALRPLSGWPGPDFDALGLSVQALEKMIGTLQHKAERTGDSAVSGSVATFLFGASTVIVLMLIAWYTGRH